MDRSANMSPPAPIPHPRDVLELLKPVTWFPPMWAFFCGVMSSGAGSSRISTGGRRDADEELV